MMSNAEISDMYQMCRTHGVLMCADECYVDLYEDEAPGSVLQVAERGFKGALSYLSLSKRSGMTGYRSAAIVGDAEAIATLAALRSSTGTAPPEFTQKAAVAALTGPMDSVQEMLAEYRRRRARVLEGLRRIPKLRCTEPQGAFYLYPNLGDWMRARGVQSTTEVAERLLKEVGVVVVPGEAFGTGEHIRISYATSMERIEEGLRRLEKFFSA